MNRNVWLGLAIFVILGSTPSYASQYLFGSTGTGSSPNFLIVNGSIYLSTADSQFLPGTDNQGWWSNTAGNVSETNNDNYIVGNLEDYWYYNNFFTFDLTQLGQTPATSATLSLNRGTSENLPVTYSLWDVTTSPEALNNNDGVNGDIFADLGSGIPYGSIGVNGSSPDPLLIELNANALNAINNAAGQGFFSIGGTLTPAAVPEPASVFLIGTGLGVIGLAAWRRRK